MALAFALFGNVLYYLLLVLGIQLAGAGLAVPIIGLLPVTVSLFGNLRGGELPLRRLALPLAAVLIGIVLVNVSRANTLLLTVVLLIGKSVSVAAGQSELNLTVGQDWLRFAGWCFVLGAGASWGGTALFNKASARLPVRVLTPERKDA